MVPTVTTPPTSPSPQANKTEEPISFSLILTLLPLVLATPTPNWTCTSLSSSFPGPGQQSLLSIHRTFTFLYGPAPLTLGPEQARVATCRGLLFGLWNGHPYAVTENPRQRQAIVLQDPGDEVTECLGHADADETLDDDLRLSYMFGFGEDSWVSGGLTEVRRCED